MARYGTTTTQPRFDSPRKTDAKLCPSCGERINAEAQLVTGDEAPTPAVSGDGLVCLHCGEILTYQNNPATARLELVVPGEEWLAKARTYTEDWRTIQRASQRIKQFRQWAPSSATLVQ